jgi:predicted alpha/beta superfamily hydrolase
VAGHARHFANDQHRQLFIADPARYAPQYGGYCVLGTAVGESAMNIDPNAWRIIDGKLYLNYDNTSIADLDTPARTELLARADANWTQIKSRPELDATR